MKELATFWEGLLYYKRRLFEDDPGRACKAETSFCGCLEAAVGENRPPGSEHPKEEKESI